MLDHLIECPFEGWKIARELGKGTYGSVYLLTRSDTGTEQQAALKIIQIPQNRREIEQKIENKQLNRNVLNREYEQTVKKALDEIKLMDGLKNNIHIVRYTGHVIITPDSRIGQDIYIQMEYLTNLSDWINSRNVTVRDIVKIGEDLCDALAFCEKKKVIHRDIKTDNVLVDSDNNFKLGDFGLARVISDENCHARPGSKNFAAPEAENNKEYSSQADLYSVGMVLYRLLNDKRIPFMEGSVTEDEANGRRFAGEPLPKPSRCPKALWSVLQKACEPDPDKRYRTASEMLGALRVVNIPDETVFDGQKTREHGGSVAPSGAIGSQSLDKTEVSFEQDIKASASGGAALKGDFTPGGSSTITGEDVNTSEKSFDHEEPKPKPKPVRSSIKEEAIPRKKSFRDKTTGLLKRRKWLIWAGVALIVGIVCCILFIPGGARAPIQISGQQYNAAGYKLSDMQLYGVDRQLAKTTDIVALKETGRCRQIAQNILYPSADAPSAQAELWMLVIVTKKGTAPVGTTEVWLSLSMPDVADKAWEKVSLTAVDEKIGQNVHPLDALLESAYRMMRNKWNLGDYTVTMYTESGDNVGEPLVFTVDASPKTDTVKK